MVDDHCSDRDLSLCEKSKKFAILDRAFLPPAFLDAFTYASSLGRQLGAKRRQTIENATATFDKIIV